MFIYPKWLWKPEVSLVTVLKLSHDIETNKYMIQDQQDLYQSNEFVKFVGPVLNILIGFWQMFGTAVCIFGALLLAPVTRLEQRMAQKKNGIRMN